MARVDVIKTIFQSRKARREGIERGEYIRGMGFAGIIDICILFLENPQRYHRFSRYLYWNDSEPECAENAVLSTFDDKRRKILWDELISSVLDLSTFDGWTTDTVTRFQVITTNGIPQLLTEIDKSRLRDYPYVFTFTGFIPFLPLVRQSALVPLNVPDFGNITSDNIRMMMHADRRVILKTYDERETSPELLVEARNLSRLTGSKYIIKVIAAVMVDNYYYGLGPDMISGLVLEYASQGNLESILCTNDVHNIPWQRRLNWAFQITHGIADMHYLDIVHGDLKCTNIVVKEDDNVAIIDLGQGGVTEGYYWPDDENETVEKYWLKSWCDIYALGVVLWQLSEPGKPVHGEAPVAKATSEIPSEYCSVVAACVAADYRRRPGAPEVLSRLTKLVEGNFQ